MLKQSGHVVGGPIMNLTTKAGIVILSGAKDLSRGRAQIPRFAQDDSNA